MRTAMASVVSCRWPFKISAKWEMKKKHRHQRCNLIYNKNTRFHYLETLILITLLMVRSSRTWLFIQKTRGKVVNLPLVCNYSYSRSGPSFHLSRGWLRYESQTSAAVCVRNSEVVVDRNEGWRYDITSLFV